jgi:hypothetical protein
VEGIIKAGYLIFTFVYNDRLVIPYMKWEKLDGKIEYVDIHLPSFILYGSSADRFQSPQIGIESDAEG